MGYVENNLLAGESVQHKTGIHWFIFLPTVIVVGIGVAMLFSGNFLLLGLGVTTTLAALLILFPMAAVRFFTSEFAVTNKRVITKQGLIRRDATETLLSKVEGIMVDQGVLGRIVGYGTVRVTGTGGHHTSFSSIRSPMEVRRHVQEQIEARDAKAEGGGSGTNG